jgi:hypothetical protein
VPQSEIGLLKKKIAAAADFNAFDDQEKILLVSVYLFETSPLERSQFLADLRTKRKSSWSIFI